MTTIYEIVSLFNTHVSAVMASDTADEVACLVSPAVCDGRLLLHCCQLHFCEVTKRPKTAMYRPVARNKVTGKIIFFREEHSYNMMIKC